MIVGVNSLLNQFSPVYKLTNLSDGQIVVYSSTQQAFVNANPATVQSSINQLGQLINVSSTVDTPTSLHNGQALTWNSTDNLWESSFINYSTLTNTPTSASYHFAGLADVASPAVNNGYVLWNSSGTGLIYSTTIPASVLSGLVAPINGGTGIDSATATNGQLLIGNGSGFTLSTITPGTGINIQNTSGNVTITAATGVVSTAIATISLQNVGSFNVGSTLPAGAVILSTKVKITVADIGSATIAVGVSGGNQFMSTSQNTPQTLGLYSVEDLITETGSVQIQATVGGVPGGSGVAIIAVMYAI